jgi:cytochrome c biogenesis protein
MFKSMQTGFLLLLMISLFASFVDLADPAPTYAFFVFYILVLLFVLNLGIYVVNKLMTIIRILRAPKGYTLALQLSLLAVHLGIALVFLGNMLDLSLGYNAHIELRPGQTFTLPGLEAKFKLADFQIDYYPDKSPSQYTSKVLMNDQDSETPYAITVNHPLEISGTKLYQESYGWLLDIELSQEGKSERFLVKPGQAAGQGETIKIIDYIPNFVPRELYGHGELGSPAIIYYIPQKNLTGAAKLGEKVKISDTGYLTFVDKQAFTVLKVKTSPGLPLVEAGGLLLIIGVVPVLVLRSKKSRQFSEDVAIK